MAIDREVLDQLLAGRDPQELFAKDGLLDELKRALSERMLAAELDDHLENEGAEGATNRRNGSSRKALPFNMMWRSASAPLAYRSRASSRLIQPR